MAVPLVQCPPDLGVVPQHLSSNDEEVVELEPTVALPDERGLADLPRRESHEPFEHGIAHLVEHLAETVVDVVDEGLHIFGVDVPVALGSPFPPPPDGPTAALASAACPMERLKPSDLPVRVVGRDDGTA